MAGEDDNNQIRFEVVCRRRRTAGDKDDSGPCETTVRVEPRYMRELGITAGDVVRISGGARSAAAICLPMSDPDMRETDEPDMEVEFLGDPGRKARRYPRIILSGQVSRNVDIPAGWQPTVCLGRFPRSETGSGGIPEAETVTLGTAGVVEKVIPGYKSNLDYFRVAGFAVTRNDLIDIPFRKEWAEKMRQDMQKEWKTDVPAGGGSPGRARPRAPPFPRSFQSVVTDVRPEGRPFWLITKNTKFEFKNGGLERLFGRHVPAPRNLVGVIPISKQILVGDTEITMASLEVYSGMMNLIWYSHQRVRISEPDFTDMRTVDRMVRMMCGGEPRPVFSLEDDLGNIYTHVDGGGGGGSTGADPTTMELVSDSSWRHTFAPSLDAGARELILTIKEVQWVRQSMATERLPSAAGRPHTEHERPPPPKVVIADGPWRFSIPVGRQDGQ